MLAAGETKVLRVRHPDVSEPFMRDEKYNRRLPDGDVAVYMGIRVAATKADGSHRASEVTVSNYRLTYVGGDGAHDRAIARELFWGVSAPEQGGQSRNLSSIGESP